ncbi:putative metal-binding motif-containing protein [Hyalangium sp.]|uniref:putative metal-binding motif-containing protein n=1 Tax=Hyalangium sp. TaxID=2028555 RepID=UPI002D361071|nr:putative metal-binding motif-containing protein [Hyalangium sp.]HYI02376.1 putative metal-binding motif-containing protein [Hyalangium sp.]
MNTCLRALGVALLGLWMGCADFDEAEQKFCERNPDRCEVIHAQVVLASGVSATCVLLEVRDASSHSTLGKKWLTRTGDVLETAVPRGSLPQTVELAARPYRDGDCQGGQEARTPNGRFETVSASFVRGKTIQADPLQLKPGTDGDGDQYVDSQAGGADCNDEAGTVNPGVVEQCSLQTDLNCDGKKGCEASGCPATACFGPPTALALELQAGTVTAGTCTSAMVKVKDESGSDTQVIAPVAVSLQTQSGGVIYFSDAACTTSIASVNLATNVGSTPFFFLGQVAGEVTLNASATGLTPASRAVQIIAGPGNRLIFASAARTAIAGACSQVVQFQAQDAQGNPAPVATTTRVALSAAPPTGFTFYSDAGCTSAVTGLDLTAGTSNGSFYFRGTRAGSVSMSLTASGFTGSLQSATINAGPPSVMVFTGPAPLPAGDCSGLVTVELRDAHDNPTPATSGTTINLTSSGVPLTFSTDAGCTPTTPTVTIAQGTGSVTFRYRGTQAGTSSISGTSGSLTSRPLSVTINPGTASVLAFTTGPQTVSAGSCSGVATVQLRDLHGNAVRVGTNTAVILSAAPPEGFQFFSEPGCAGAAVPSVTMSANSSDASFYFRGTRAGAGAATLAAALSSITGNQSVTINPGPPTTLAFPQSPLTVAAGGCTPVTLRVNDPHGNATPVSGNQTIDLAASPSTGFTLSTAANCAGPTNQVIITSGQSSTTVYMRGTVAGNVTVTATRASLTPGTLALTVNPAAPSKLIFLTAPQTLEVGACSAITTVRLLDTFDNVVTATANTPISLMGSTANITFYSGAGCSSPTTFVTVPAGGSNASFYFKDTAAETVTVTVSSNGLTSATQQQTINVPAPTELAFTTTARTVQVAACSDIVTVEVRASGSPTTVIAPTTVNLNTTPSASLTFYSNNTCTTVVTSVTISPGQGSASFYFKGSAPGTVAITASAGSLTSATQNAFITPVPTQWRFTTPARTVMAGSCSSLIRVQSSDPSNSAAPVAMDTTVNLGQSGTPADPQFRFYSGASCSTVVTSVTVPSNQSAVLLFFKAEKARTVTLTASGTLTSATQDHTVTPGSMAVLAFSASTPPQTLLAGTCAMRTVQSQDAFGNFVSTGVTADLSASATTEFFSDAGCTTPTTEVTIAAGNSSANFYFKGLTGGINATAPLTLTASAPGLTSATQTESIIPTVRTGTCILDDVSVTCPITPALLDVHKAFLTFQATSTHARSDRGNVRCFLDGGTQVRCERFDNNATVNIRWSAAEFPSGVAVQHHATNCSGDITPVPLFATTPSGTFLLLSSQRDINNMGSGVYRLVEMKSSTLAEIRKLGGCGVTDNNHLQAVSYSGSQLQRGVTSLASGATNTEVTLASPVALDRSIVLYSYINDGTSARICERALRGELINNGATVRFSRGEGDTVNCAGSNFGEISWEVVTFPVGTVVQQVTQQLTGATASVPLTTPVDLSRTLVFGGGQWSSGQLHGEGRYASGELINEMRALAVLSNNSTLLFYRESFINTATFTAYVVQFKP